MAINVVFKRLKIWLVGDKMQVVMTKFKNWCGMLSVVGAIDGTHIAITKHFGAFAENYYYQIKGYSIVARTVVDSQKTFTDVYVGLLNSMNDNQVL